MYSSSIQESAPVPLNGNYRKPQLSDNRVVLVSFQDGELGFGMQYGKTGLRKHDVVTSLSWLNGKPSHCKLQSGLGAYSSVV